MPRFTPEQIGATLQILGRREREYLELLQTSPDEARAELARNRAELSRMKGSPPSRPNLTADKILHSAYYPMHNAALEVYKDPGIPKQVFIGWFDYATGIVNVASAVFEAEQEIEGMTDKNAVEAVTMVEQRHTPLSPDASARIYLSQMDNAKRSARLLIEDPTGIKLIETAVEEIRQDAGRPPRERKFNRFHSYEEPQLILAGAEFAERAYKALYPLTSPPPPQR